MAQLLSPGGPRPPDVVTVADLLSRNAPVPVKIPGSEQAPAVPVESLLRREGHDPGAEPREQSTARRLVVRGAAVVAGTALVAGSAFGGAVIVQTFLGEPGPLADPAPAAPTTDAPTTDAAPGALVDRAAATNGLDAGTGAPTSWAEVAFPTPAVGTARTAQRAAAAPGSPAPVTAAPAAKEASRKKSGQKESAQKESAQKESAQKDTAPTGTAPTGTGAPKAESAQTTTSTPATSSKSSGGGLLGEVVGGLGGLLGLG